MRYFKATLVIGIVSIVAVLVLDASGWLKTAEVWTQSALQQLSEDRTLVPVSRGSVFLVAAVLAFFFAWTTADISRPAAKTVIALGGFCLTLTSAPVLALYGKFYPPFQAALAILFSFALGIGYAQSAGGSRKRVLTRLFGQRLSRKQFTQLVDSSLPLEFPGVEQNATVLVCEVHNHVELLERLEPADYVAMTNLYLKAASDYLVDAGGYLDECNGESLRVIFGAPLAREDHARIACRAALDLVSRVEELNKECDARWHQRLDFRVAVHSGPMIAAAYGGTRLGSFSVAGTTVEFARRLCAACATYGCRILVGPETYADAREIVEARPIELLRRPDGRRIELYEVLAPAHGLSPERAQSRDHFWKGVIYYREKKWELALEEFSKARVPGIPDPGLDNFILRTERARRGTESTPAPGPLLAEIR